VNDIARTRAAWRIDVALHHRVTLFDSYISALKEAKSGEFPLAALIDPDELLHSRNSRLARPAWPTVRLESAAEGGTGTTTAGAEPGSNAATQQPGG